MERALAFGASSPRFDSCDIQMFFPSKRGRGGCKEMEPVTITMHTLVSQSRKKKLLALSSLDKQGVSAIYGY